MINQRKIPGKGSKDLDSGSSVQVAKYWTSLSKPPPLWSSFDIEGMRFTGSPRYAALSHSPWKRSLTLSTTLSPPLNVCLLLYFPLRSNPPPHFRSIFISISFLLPPVFFCPISRRLWEAEGSGSGACFSIKRLTPSKALSLLGPIVFPICGISPFQLHSIEIAETEPEGLLKTKVL